MPTYGNPHTLPPAQCSTNTVTFTDATLTADSIKPRKIHLDELRLAINNEETRRGLSTTTWTDSTIVANSTLVRDNHINELRTAISKVKTGDCSGDTYYCPQDTSGAISWTDSTITINSTNIRNDHVSEVRTKISALKTSCICEAEQCQYCADCGYSYQYCPFGGCGCDDHKYSECGYSLVWAYVCASTNLAAGTAHPYRTASGNPLTTNPWNGQVPWAMCNYTPPGSNWGSCEYQGGHTHTDWNCKCNPFTWS
jgi:hypothetical protein